MKKVKGYKFGNLLRGVIGKRESLYRVYKWELQADKYLEVKGERRVRGEKTGDISAS